MGEVLPQGWECIPLGEVGQVGSGITLGRKLRDKPTSPVQYLRVANVKDGFLDLSDVSTIEATDSEIEKYQLQYGDILLTEGGDPDKLGRGTFWEEQIPGCIHQNHIFRVRFDLDRFCPQFLSFQVGSPYGKAYFLANAKQTTGIATINQKILKGFPLLVPPFAEQKRIVGILNDRLAAIDKARAAAEAQLEAAKTLPAAYLRQVFDSPEAQKWPRKKLGEVAELGSGITLGRKLKAESRKVPYLRVANVKDGYLDLEDVSETDATEAEIQKRLLKYGDILLTEGGDPDKLGRGTLWEEQIPGCIHQNHIFRVRFDLNKFSPHFISFQVGSPYGKAYFLAHAKQTTGIATINKTILSGFPLMTPDIETQQDIAVQLSKQKDKLSQVQSQLESQLEDINKIPAALLRQAFNGEL